MARVGFFDPSIATEAWFDRDDAPLGWFDSDLLEIAAGGGGATNYSLSCSSGVYAYSGGSSALAFARNLTASAGSYSYAGGSATLTYSPGAGATNYSLSCGAGSYSYTGAGSSFVFARKLSLSAGSYGYAGSSAAFLFIRKLSLGAGSYAYTGTSATLIATINGAGINYSMPLSAGSYTYNGASTRILLGTTMIVQDTDAIADAVWAKMLGARSAGSQVKAIAATLVGETSGAGTSHITFADGAVTVEADVPLPGEAGDRTNVTISV